VAPIAPLGRQAAIQKVAAGELPFRTGPVMVLEQDGMLRIRQLVVDQVAAKTASQRARSPSWMPEHHYAAGQPIGEIYAEAATAAELIEVMKTMPWPDHW